MAFPTTPLLDAFTGADETPITTNWTTPLVPGDNSARRISNQYTPAVAGGWSGAWYDLSQFGPDCDAYCTIATMPDDDISVNLWARIQSPGTSGIDGYMAKYTHDIDSPPSTAALLIVTNGVPTGIGASFSIPTLANGNKIGMLCIGSTIEFWYNDGTGWTLAASRTDTTYTTAGYIGIEVNGTTVRIDDFGGGTYSAVPPISIPTQAARW